MGVHRYEKLVLYKNFFIYVSMGVNRYENFIFVRNILDSLINGCTQEKNFNIPVFSPPYKCKKTCKNISKSM